MKRVIAFIDPLLVIGVLASVILALVLVLIGVDKVDSLLIGLVSTVITLLIDLMARQRDSEQRLSQAIKLGNQLVGDEETLSILSHLTTNYLSVKKGWFDHFRQRADDELNECKNTIQAMANGYLVVEPTGKYVFGKKGVEMATRTVKAVSYEPLELWRTVHWQKSIEVNAKAIERGVTVTRVFVQDQEKLSEYKDVLNAHIEAGANVFVVSPKELDSGVLESYFIVDDKILAEFYFTLDGQLKEERISINPIEVDKAKSEFNYILRNASKYKDGS